MTLVIVFAGGVFFLLCLAFLAFLLGRNTTRLNRSEPAWDEEPTAPLPLSQQQMILTLIQQGRKIEAIKQYKLLTGVSLKTAKGQVDRLERESRFGSF